MNAYVRIEAVRVGLACEKYLKAYTKPVFTSSISQRDRNMVSKLLSASKVALKSSEEPMLISDEACDCLKEFLI